MHDVNLLAMLLTCFAFLLFCMPDLIDELTGNCFHLRLKFLIICASLAIYWRFIICLLFSSEGLCHACSDRIRQNLFFAYILAREAIHCTRLLSLSFYVSEHRLLSGTLLSFSLFGIRTLFSQKEDMCSGCLCDTSQFVVYMS
jgi:hypothetical protein